MIVAIILGGIIVLSVVLCIARCICCGAELACCCFKCCTCCCPSGGRRGNKRVLTPPPGSYNNSAYGSALPPAPLPPQNFNQPYQSHAPPTFRPAPAPAPAPTFNPAPPAPAPAFNTAPKSEAPQFARFDAHAQPVNEDALPAMPSWRDAKSVHVEEEVVPEKRDDVEMDRLDHNGSMAGTSMAAVAAGGAARMSPGPGRSPVHRTQTENGYGYSAQNYQNDPYASPSSHYSPQGGAYGQQQDAYRGMSPTHPTGSPVYGAGPPSYTTNQYDRRSPGPAAYNTQPNYTQPIYDQPAYNQPSYNQYSQQDPYTQPTSSRTPPPLATNTYPYGAPNNYHDPMDVSPVDPANAMYNTGYNQAPVPAPAPMRDPSPVYAPSGSTRFEPPAPSASPAPAYPGQQTYTSPTEPAGYPAQGQQAPYRAYTPASAQMQGVSRKPVEGSWKEI